MLVTVNHRTQISLHHSNNNKKMSVDIVVFGVGAPSKFSPSILGSGVGGHAVRIASKMGLTVRVVVRNVEKYQAIFGELPGVTLVKGDVTVQESVAECVKQASAAIFAVQAADDKTAMEVDRDGAILLANECVKVNCKMILISSIMVSPKHRFNPLRVIMNVFVKSGMMDAKWQSEEAMRKLKGLRYTIIRPGALTDGPAMKNEYKISQGDVSSFPYLSMPKEDVAKVAIAAAMDEASAQTTFEITGSWSKKPQTVEGIFASLKKDHE
jgi:uncharacterized protein YbjT (DUF2867 family)